jgi:hypothetical protein
MTKFGKLVSTLVIEHQSASLGNRVGSLVGIAAGEAVNGKVSKARFVRLCEKAYDSGVKALQKMQKES